MNQRLYRGRLVRADGNPVADAVVMIASGSAPTPDLARRTNEDGTFALALPAGTFELHITPRGESVTKKRLDTNTLDEEFVITLEDRRGP